MEEGGPIVILLDLRLNYWRTKAPYTSISTSWTMLHQAMRDFIYLQSRTGREQRLVCIGNVRRTSTQKQVHPCNTYTQGIYIYIYNLLQSGVVSLWVERGESTRQQVLMTEIEKERMTSGRGDVKARWAPSTTLPELFSSSSTTPSSSPEPRASDPQSGTNRHRRKTLYASRFFKIPQSRAHANIFKFNICGYFKFNLLLSKIYIFFFLLVIDQYLDVLRAHGNRLENPVDNCTRDIIKCPRELSALTCDTLVPGF